MAKPVVLITGANGEIGRSLLKRLHGDGRYRVVTSTHPLPEAYRPLCLETYAGNIMDRYLLDQIAAHHEIEVVFHLARCFPRAASATPSWPIRSTSRERCTCCAWRRTVRPARPRRYAFCSRAPSPCTGCRSLEEKKSAGRIREEHWNLPITMYGCNKLYCEHLGRYFTHHYRQLGALSDVARLDFRSIRFPGLISAETAPTGGTSDFGPEMLHAAAQNQPYSSFVGPEARIPFMTMTDATRALISLLDADRERWRARSTTSVPSALRPSRSPTVCARAFPRRRSTTSPTRCDRGSSILGPRTWMIRGRARTGTGSRVTTSTAPSTSTWCPHHQAIRDA